MAKVALSRHFLPVSVLLLVAFLGLFSKAKGSVVLKLIKAVKRQKEKFRPYEERSPKVSKQSGLSAFEKRQLYWYYKDFVGRREVNKIWKEADKNITDEAILTGDSFLPIKSEFKKFGQFAPNSFRMITPAAYDRSMFGCIYRSNVIFNRGARALDLDCLGKLSIDSETPEGVLFGGKKRTLAGGHPKEPDHVWGTIVSPCKGEIQYNSALEESLEYSKGTSQFIIYCDNGTVKERYSLFGGRVVEFLNGKLEFGETNSLERPDLSRKFRVQKGSIVLRILELYQPPIYEEDLIAIPIFMPCVGKIAWEKRHKQIFVKGERVIEFICRGQGEIKTKHLISPSRGYTEPFEESELAKEARSGILDKSSNITEVHIGFPLGIMRLELRAVPVEQKSYQNQEEILIRMPCIGRLEYPSLRKSYVFRDEVLFVVVCKRNGEIITEQSPIQGFVQLLVTDTALIHKNVYMLRLRALDLSEMPPLDDIGDAPRYKFDLGIIKEADPMTPLYIERLEQN
ncbi:hypothetical protein HWI79_2513 [Cryptosporidium felis]|nr:hypothetical protein HWI79_2513 [Cryptosporidium felis]